MPWQDNSGKGGGRGPVRGPWGQQPRPPGGGEGGNGRGSGGGEPPDLEELLKASRQRLKRAFPRGGGGGKAPEFNRKTILMAAAGVAFVWALSGFYQVNPAELGVVTTFGKFERVTSPGLHWHAPYPFQNARKETVTEFRESLVPITSQRGDRSAGLMLTGDKNIVDVGIKVQWRIKPDILSTDGSLPPVAQFMFTIDDPANLVSALAESAVREVVGRNELDFVQTEGRAVVMDDTKALVQQSLDEQGAGIEIVSVNL